jgi:hypothetical protein
MEKQNTIRSEISNKIYSLHKHSFQKKTPNPYINLLMDIGVQQRTLALALNTSQSSVSNMKNGVKKISRNDYEILEKYLLEAVDIAEEQVERVSGIYPEEHTKEYRQLLCQAKELIQEAR